MTLKNYDIGYTNNGIERKVKIKFNKKGLVMIAENADLNPHDMCLLSTITALYVASHLRGVIPDTMSLGNLGVMLYQEFVGGSYEGLKSIEEMDLDAFNKYLREHGL